MKKRRKKRKVKWGRVLFAIIFPIIIIGGIIMYYNHEFNNNNSYQEADNNIIDNHPDNNILDENHDEFETNQTTSNLDSAPSNNQEFRDLEDGEYLTSKGYTLKIENGIAYIDDHVIVNKTYSLPNNYGSNLTDEVMRAFNEMNADAISLGLNLWIQSGYRSYNKQNSIYNNYVSKDGQENADTYSARPGHSEHQTGLAFDLNTIDDSFTYTNEGKWVNNNCYRFGFILRYPKGKDNITGYMHESWHLRYVGKELAEKLYNNGDWITIEEYYGLSSTY